MTRLGLPTALATLLVVKLFVTSSVLANSPLLNPVLSVVPKLPVAGGTATLRIFDATNVYANVLDSSIVRTGNMIEIRASIELGRVNLTLWYEFEKSLTDLPAGDYNVKYFARTKRLDPETPFTDYALEGEWRFLVVDSAGVQDAIEYFHSGLEHYFLTSYANEIAALDGGLHPGWARTGQVVRVVAASPAVPGALPVCRFYAQPATGVSTHVYTANAQECQVLIGQSSTWLLETPTAFAVAPIDLVSASCPINSVPVYRLWNGVAEVNHRYTTSKEIQAAMVQQGWIAEGSGDPPAVWCALPTVTN